MPSGTTDPQRGSEPFAHVVLHEPEIPQNTGNIGRTCVALGAKLWLVRPLGFRLDASRLRRAGLDYWDALDVEVADDWGALTRRLDPARFWLFSRKAERCCYDASYARGDVLVFGSESRGLPDGLLSTSPSRCLKIPMVGPTRSLNLACAASVAMYETYRQVCMQA